jgi:hypothetical protein
MSGNLKQNQRHLRRKRKSRRGGMLVSSSCDPVSISPSIASVPSDSESDPVCAGVNVASGDADVSAAISQVFLSKTETRQRRRQERLLVKPYHVETRRPLVCLAFVLPFLVFYEVGSILFGQDSFRSGIDQWFHQILNQFGAGQLVLLPLVTVGIMLTWHHQQNDHWRIRIPILLGMLVEAVGLGAILFALLTRSTSCLVVSRRERNSQ